jgi:hypothetical protein
MSESDPAKTPPKAGRALDRFVPPILLVAGIIGTIPVVRSLHVTDLNWCYRYLSPDSYDWINNGLYWAGAAVSPSFRPPGLPLVIALLVRLNLLPWLPVLNFVVLGATAALLYRLLTERFSPAVSAVAAWTYFSNSFVQDFTRWILAEGWAVFFLVLAALFFLRAEKRSGAYVSFGAAIGISFLFHYGAFPAGIGFITSAVLTRRADLCRRQFWAGMVAAGVLPGVWLVVRWRHALLRPDAPRHGVEALIAFVPQNISFYAFAGLALVGLVVLPLYVEGALRCLGRSGRKERLLRGVFAPVLAALALFFGAFYDWTDKRFLLYLFPFAIGFLALGVERLLDWGRHGLAFRIASVGYLLAALGWNQITYPPYGIQFLAVTPRDFLEAATERDAKQKTTLRLSGARILRVHKSMPGGFAGGLFDFRLRTRDCQLSDDDDYAALQRLRPVLDEKLGPGAPIGMERLAGWPDDGWGSRNRMSNVLGRPVVLPDSAPCRIAPAPRPGFKEVFASGPYFIVCRESPAKESVRHTGAAPAS